MKSLCYILCLAVMSLDSLLDMSNRMDHLEFQTEALRHDSLLKATPSQTWMRLIGEEEPDSLALACMPTLYDIVVSEHILDIYGNERDSLVKDWVAFHANDTTLLPLVYAYTGNPTWQHFHLYDSLPDCWERGLLLRFRPSVRHDKLMLPKLEAYVAAYPDSPFSDMVRSRIDNILRLSFSGIMQETFTSEDSIAVHFTVTNARRVAFYLHRKHGRRVLDSCLVDISSSDRIFTLSQHAALAPRKSGKYRLELRMPEDTCGLLYPKCLNTTSLYFRVSDKCSFSYTEHRYGRKYDRRHSVTTHALTGKRIRPNRTKLVRSGGYERAAQHLLVYPNATIFRPGDTLRLAVMESRKTIDSLRMVEGEKLHLRLKDARYKTLVDTVLFTDAYGEAAFAWQVPADAPLGNYSLHVSGDRIATYYGSRASQYFRFRVEDYRLPTFSLTLDKQNTDLHAGDSLVVIRGVARLFSGLPMANLPVKGVLTYGGEEHEFTCTTSFDGAFEYVLPATLTASLQANEWLMVDVEATSPDGETHEFHQSIWVNADANADADDAQGANENENIVWTQDQRLWLPQDSVCYSADGKTASVLIGTRQASPVYIITSSRHRLVDAAWHTLPTGLNRLSFALPTDTNDYLDIQVITTVHGQVYKECVHAVAPLRTELHLVPLSFRDHLCPGVEESWRWQLLDQQGHPIQARLLATMVDEAVLSLWPLRYQPLPAFWSEPSVSVYSTGMSWIWRSLSSVLPERKPFSLRTLPLYEPYKTMEEVVVTGYGSISGARNTAVLRGYGSSLNASSDRVMLNASAQKVMVEEDEEEEMEIPASALDEIQVREGDTRLAFFLPNLETDSAGIISHTFRAPLDNTRWHLKGLAWATNGASLVLDTMLTARRTLTAHLTVPRFLRQGDRVVLPCLIRNEADSARTITVAVDLSLAGEELYAWRKDTCIGAQGELVIPVPCHVTTAADSLVARVRVLAADGSSDGEQRLLPVLPVVEPVVETVSFYVHPGDTAAAVAVPALPDGATDVSLVVSYCSNPLAYLFGGLPTAIDTSYVNPLPMTRHLFALSVGNRLADTYPGYHDRVDTAPLIRALRKFQRPSGGLSWLSDSRSTASTYITLQFVYLMGELRAMDALPEDLLRMSERALHYLDRYYAESIAEAEKRAKKNGEALDYALYSEYAYVRAAFGDLPFVADAERCYTLVLNAMPKKSDIIRAPYQALCLERAGRHAEALHIVNYLRRHAVTSRDLGMYFNNLPKYHLWFSICQQQAAYLRAFAAVDPQAEEIEALRQWLLLGSQTMRLDAYAASALLLSGENWLRPCEGADPAVRLTVDTIPYGASYQPRPSDGRPAWGSVRLSYQAPLTAVRPFATKALKVERRYVLVRGDEERLVTDTTVLEQGDLVRVCLTVTTDRAMDGLVVCDHKPASLEPSWAYSGFVWRPVDEQGRVRGGFLWSGVLSYEEYKNEQTVVYIEHLPKGTYTHTYDCRVTTSGTTLSGLTTATASLPSPTVSSSGLIPDRIAVGFSSHTSVLPLTVKTAR